MEQNETTMVPQDELTDRIASRLGARQQKLEQMEQWDKAPAKRTITRLRPLFVCLAVAACLAAVVWVAPWQSSTNPLDELGIGTPEITVYRSASSDANAINALIDRGNSVLIIEHDPEIIKCADYIIDLGPGGGKNGGNIVATGTPEKIAANKKSFTGKYIKGKI